MHIHGLCLGDADAKVFTTWSAFSCYLRAWIINGIKYIIGTITPFLSDVAAQVYRLLGGLATNNDDRIIEL